MHVLVSGQNRSTKNPRGTRGNVLQLAYLTHNDDITKKDLIFITFPQALFY